MPEPLAETVISKLAVHLGPHVARIAVKSFAKKAGVPGHEQLTPAHVPQLMQEIRPMLNVMIGKAPSESVIADIERATARVPS
jgi:hypothetical protein